MSLSGKQQAAFLEFSLRRRSGFLTGFAGTGKSHVIAQLIKYFDREDINYCTLAPTGRAACNIGGRTIHQYFKFGLADKDTLYYLSDMLDTCSFHCRQDHSSTIRKLGYCNHNTKYIKIKNCVDLFGDKALMVLKYLYQQVENRHHDSECLIYKIKRLDTIIIDEISMVLPDLLYKVHAICSFIKSNSDYFGGIQMIFVGDFAQLLPIIPKTPSKCTLIDTLVEHVHYPHLLQFPLFLNTIQSNIYILDINYRQEDISWLEILRHCRHGCLTLDDVHELEKRFVASSIDVEERCGHSVIQLTCRLDDVNQINEDKLKTETIGPLYNICAEFDIVKRKDEHSLDQFMHQLLANDLTKERDRMLNRIMPIRTINIEEYEDVTDEVNPSLTAIDQKILQTKSNLTEKHFGCLYSLTIGVHCRILIQRNLFVEKKIYNGRCGTILAVGSLNLDRYESICITIDGLSDICSSHVQLGRTRKRKLFQNFEEDLKVNFNYLLFDNQTLLSENDLDTWYDTVGFTQLNNVADKYDNMAVVIALDNSTQYMILRPIYYVTKVTPYDHVSCLQFPFCLAWAFSIHKSQGCTLDSALIDLSGIFTEGQVYTALSRVRTIEGLYLKPYSFNNISFNASVIEWESKHF